LSLKSIATICANFDGAEIFRRNRCEENRKIDAEKVTAENAEIGRDNCCIRFGSLLSRLPSAFAIVANFSLERDSAIVVMRKSGQLPAMRFGL
jgi:hypothetical protein